MSFEDKSMQCFDCGTTFTFSSDDQGIFQSWGYTRAQARQGAGQR